MPTVTPGISNTHSSDHKSVMEIGLRDSTEDAVAGMRDSPGRCGLKVEELGIEPKSSSFRPSVDICAAANLSLL